MRKRLSYFLLFTFYFGLLFSESMGESRELGDRIRGSVRYAETVWLTGTLQGYSEFTAPHDPLKCPPVTYRRKTLSGTRREWWFKHPSGELVLCPFETWGGYGEYKLNAAADGLVEDASQGWYQQKDNSSCEPGECCSDWKERVYWVSGISLPSGASWEEVEDDYRVWYGEIEPENNFFP